MKRNVSLTIALIIGLSALVLAQLTREAAIAKTEAVLKNMQDGSISEVLKEFDARMTKELPETRVKAVWPALVAQFGALKSIDERREGQVQGRQAVELILSFEKNTIVQRAVFDSEGKIAGLVFQPLSMAVLPKTK